jgi:hypothetical protein
MDESHSPGGWTARRVGNGTQKSLSGERREVMKLDAKFYGEIRKAKDGSLVPDDEYDVFLVKDNAFASVLPLYREACVRLGADASQVAAVDAMIERADAWRAENPHRLKVPDAAGERLLDVSAVQGGEAAAATVSIDVVRQRALDFAEGYRFGHEDGIEGNAEDADTAWCRSKASEELAASQARNEQRCEGRYQVPQTSPPRIEGFDVTYRCALPNGHSGPHGAASAPSAPTPAKET